MPTGRPIEWTQEMDDYLRKYYPIKLNCDLCRYFGITTPPLLRRVRILGLKKADNYAEIYKKEHSRRQSIAEKRKDGRTQFKKGQHASPATEFKKGVKPTDEEREKRKEGIRKMVYSERIRIKYDLPQRTKRKFNKRYAIDK